MNLKTLKKSIFQDRRGLLWTTWEKGNFKNIKFNHDKFSLLYFFHRFSLFVNTK